MTKHTPVFFSCLAALILLFSGCKKCYTCTGVVYCSTCQKMVYNAVGIETTTIIATDCSDKSTYPTTQFNCRQLMQNNTNQLIYSFINTDSSIQTSDVCNDPDEDAYISRGYVCYPK